MSRGNQKPLRQLATEKLHGKGANPTMLGDPVSLKAETTRTDTDTDNGPSYSSSSSSRPSWGREQNEPSWLPDRVRSSSGGGSHEEKMLSGKGHHVRGLMTDEIRQGKVSAPPGKSVEVDATSLGRERVVGDAAKMRKGSKL